MTVAIDSFVGWGTLGAVSETVGDRIKRKRKARRLTQTQLAVELDVEPMTVSRWERGMHEPSFATLTRISTALGCSERYLLTGELDADARVEPAPDYPALADFLKTELGKGASADEVETLRSLRAATGRPTVATYQTVLLALRSTMEAS